MYALVSSFAKADSGTLISGGEVLKAESNDQDL